MKPTVETFRNEGGEHFELISDAPWGVWRWGTIYLHVLKHKKSGKLWGLRIRNHPNEGHQWDDLDDSHIYEVVAKETTKTEYVEA